MQLQKPTYDLKPSWFLRNSVHNLHKNFPINPYVPATKRAKLFRGKQQQKLSWLKLVDDLEPYSLYPREELVRMLKLYHFFILYHVRKGDLVELPYLGQFVGDTEEFSHPWFSKHKALQDEPNFKHDTMLFRPAPFLHWYLNPTQYTPYKYQHVPTYFRAFEKFQRELYKSDLDWYDIFPNMKYLEFSLERIRHNGTIKRYAGMNWVEDRKEPKPKRAPAAPGVRRKRYPPKPKPKVVKDPYTQV